MDCILSRAVFNSHVSCLTLFNHVSSFVSALSDHKEAQRVPRLCGSPHCVWLGCFFCLPSSGRVAEHRSWGRVRIKLRFALPCHRGVMTEHG